MKPIAISALNNETGKKSCTSEAPFSGPTICISSERNQEPPNLHNLNAFDIISLSTGFDLSGLFGERYGWREARFTSRKPVATVLVKLKELTKALKLKVTKTDNGVLKLPTTKEGRKGRLELDAVVFLRLLLLFSSLSWRRPMVTHWSIKGRWKRTLGHHSRILFGHCKVINSSHCMLHRAPMSPP